jgi:peroxiredoxin
MLSEGTDAPSFTLPALVDGERRRVSLSEYVGDDVVILAFYPADFNPACDEESCDLDELDLFTMQKDVTILGISPDSVYSHRAFAEQYDLKVPLLADTDGSVAAEYDIGLEDDIGQHLLERAVVVVDHDGEITYTWSTEEMTTLPRVEEIKDALADTGGDDTAFARYRVGHAHYTEGRRAFTSAMNGFRESEWMMAQKDFAQAREEFEEAADQFDTAVRFVDDDGFETIYEQANTKATSLWQAADWLTQSASAYSSGNGVEGQKLREDAEHPIESARGFEEPPDPDEWPPDVDTLEKDEEEEYSILPNEDDGEAATLDVDIDDQMDVEDIDVEDSADAGAASLDGGVTTETASAEGAVPEETPDAGTAAADSADAAAAEEDIDDDELAEIQAELEANNPDEEPGVDEITEESTSIVDAPPMGDDEDAAETADQTTAADDEAAAQRERGERRFTQGKTLELTDNSDEDRARAELEQLQADLGVELPGSDLPDDDEPTERREFTQGKTLNLTDPTDEDAADPTDEDAADPTDEDAADPMDDEESIDDAPDQSTDAETDSAADAEPEPTDE